MTAIVIVLVALVLVVSVGLLVVAYRHRPATPAAPRATPSGAGEANLERLQVGAEVLYDDREWVVIGAQRVAAVDGFAPWTAWHLDCRGQQGWMATVDGDRTQLTFVVGAERAETIDPTLDPVIWRDVPWTRIAETADGPQPVTVEGQRRRLRQAPEDLTDDPIERISLTRDDLPRRRLILERRTGDERWTAWIGDRIPATLVHVTRWP
ncbi:MAG: hypothetical protein WC558_13350 [Patulibacter sp.]